MELPVLFHPKDREEVLRRLTTVFSTSDPKTEEDVRKIIARVKRDGDKALIHFSRKFDSHPVTFPRALALKEDHLEKAWDQLPADLRKALQRARMRITRFHESQKIKVGQMRQNGNRMSLQNSTR